MVLLYRFSFSSFIFDRSNKMKYLLAVVIALVSLPTFAAEEKKVCVDQTDAKTKKTKQVCRTVKVHKKLEGTKIPDKK